MRHSTHGRSHFLVRLACVKHAASVQSEPESNSPVQICIKSLRQSRRNQNLKVLFPFAIHLSMNQNLPPFQAASGFMPFSPSTVKNFFRFAIFFRGRISFLPSRRKVTYRLFDFHLSSNFLNFFLEALETAFQTGLKPCPKCVRQRRFQLARGRLLRLWHGSVNKNLQIWQTFFVFAGAQQANLLKP